LGGGVGCGFGPGPGCGGIGSGVGSGCFGHFRSVAIESSSLTVVLPVSPVTAPVLSTTRGWQLAPPEEVALEQL